MVVKLRVKEVMDCLSEIEQQSNLLPNIELISITDDNDTTVEVPIANRWFGLDKNRTITILAHTMKPKTNYSLLF